MEQTKRLRLPLPCALLVLVGLSGLSGCAGGPANPKSANLTPNPTSTGTLAVSPTSLNFGNVVVGTSASLTGKLSATNADVTVASADWTGSGYSISEIAFPVMVRAGQSVNYKVTFIPPSGGTSNGSVAFTSNATDARLQQSFIGDGTQASTHSVALSWNASASSVVGYNIYRGTQSGGPYSTRLNSSLLANTAYTDALVESGSTYYYVATAVDSNNVESSYSNETSATIP
jgi:fibronectin type 3 domain-containing protein